MADNNPDCPDMAKAFVPLGTAYFTPHHLFNEDSSLTAQLFPENNPTVMTSLLQNLGLPSNIGFSDIYSLTEPDLLALVPRPSRALLLVFPISPTYEAGRVEEDTTLPTYEGSGPDEPVMWFKQTIKNACGLIGLLHAAANGGVRDYVIPGSDLDKLLKEAEGLKPVERAELLYQSKALEAAHASAAAKGDSEAPAAESSLDLHFVCFAKGKDGHLYELDGRRKGPLDRGLLPEGEDVLGEKALALGPLRFLEREKAGGDLRFSCVSLGELFD